jgi:polar amino acid transport system ATP-binding protein
MIEVKDLRKSFDGRVILDGVSLTLEKGEVVSLVGPSGGGKSTLLRCLNGLETFDGGSVKVGEHELRAGRYLGRDQTLHTIRQKLGFVFQQWHLFAHRTALGNVIEAPMMVRGISQAEALTKAKEILARVGMSHREGAYPAEMSGGEQQRVAIARALAMEPTALLMDEPTSALDPERVGDVIELLQGLAKDGLTIVAVTHEMRFARAISSRVVVLHSGRIVEEGKPGDVLDHPKHERTRAFLGHDD